MSANPADMSEMNWSNQIKSVSVVLIRFLSALKHARNVKMATSFLSPLGEKTTKVHQITSKKRERHNLTQIRCKQDSSLLHNTAQLTILLFSLTNISFVRQFTHQANGNIFVAAPREQSNYHFMTQ